jgi:hypothetical protein
MAQEHPLTTIEQTATAQQKAPEALRSGHINYGKVLYDTFGNEKDESTKVQVLQRMAHEITPSEFSTWVKSAKEMADAEDKGNGFKKPEGATGQANYGPKRRMLNSRMSEARNIFGVAKQAPAVLREKGYWLALTTAKKWLKENNKTWDGNRAETPESRAARMEILAKSTAFGKVSTANPQKAGESTEQYMVRIAGLVDQEREKMAAQSFDERVETIKASLKKQFKDELNALFHACDQLVTELQTQDLATDTQDTEETEETQGQVTNEDASDDVFAKATS